MTHEQDMAGEQKVIPRALPAGEVVVLGRGVAKKTCSKFIAVKWYHLVKGEKFEAPYEVIVQLRASGFAE